MSAFDFFLFLLGVWLVLPAAWLVCWLYDQLVLLVKWACRPLSRALDRRRAARELLQIRRGMARDYHPSTQVDWLGHRRPDRHTRDTATRLIGTRGLEAIR